MLLSVPLGFEYEATCRRAEHVLAAKANEADIANLLDAIFDAIEPVEVHYQWRPQLSDAGDELVLEAAVKWSGGCDFHIQPKRLRRRSGAFWDRGSEPCRTRLRRIRT